MKKFWRGFRKEADKSAKENKHLIRADQLKKLRLPLEMEGHGAEAEYIQLLRDWKPDISNEDLADRIKLYHAAVSVRQSRDRGSR
jgi:hypothetical protein